MKTSRMTNAALLLGLSIGFGAVTSAWAVQEHMVDALQSLQTAKSQLEKASHNKGGHREKALELVDQAIVQVKEGIEYAKAHH